MKGEGEEARKGGAEGEGGWHEEEDRARREKRGEAEREGRGEGRLRVFHADPRSSLSYTLSPAPAPFLADSTTWRGGGRVEERGRS